MGNDEVRKAGQPPSGFAGSNTLKINEATLMRAVQEWLDRNMLTAPRVTSITFVSHGGHDRGFEIGITDQPPTT
jgi:hypothetical protein